MTLETRAQLETILEERNERPQARWRDVDFIVWHTLTLEPMRARSWQRLNHPSELVRYVIVDLPRPVRCDLLLERRADPDPDARDPLARHFAWSATSDQLVRSVLDGPLLDTLVDLSNRYRQVTVTDEWVGFGPTARVASEMADDLDRLVTHALEARQGADPGPPGWNTDAVLPTRNRDASSFRGLTRWWTDSDSMATDEPEEEAELPYCYFCGEALPGIVRTCPACGLELELELDES